MGTFAAQVQIGSSDFKQSSILINKLRHEFAPRNKGARRNDLRTRAFKVCRILNEKSPSLPDDETLKPHLQMLLWYLESRSFFNRGDCKWKDSEIAELFKVDVRTVQRWVEKLEKLGFLIRFTKRHFDKKGKNFFCDRAFRMVRVFVFYCLKPHKAKVIGWSSDPRPYVDEREYWIERGWFFTSPVEEVQYIDDWPQRVTVLPVVGSKAEMVEKRLWSWGLDDAIRILRSMALEGNEKAKKIMGSRVYEVRG